MSSPKSLALPKFPDEEHEAFQLPECWQALMSIIPWACTPGPSEVWPLWCLAKTHFCPFLLAGFPASWGSSWASISGCFSRAGITTRGVWTGPGISRDLMESKGIPFFPLVVHSQMNFLSILILQQSSLPPAQKFPYPAAVWKGRGDKRDWQKHSELLFYVSFPVYIPFPLF